MENKEIKIHNSSIKKISEPDFSKEVVIDRVNLLPERVFRQQQEILKKTFGDRMSDEEVVNRINQMVIRDKIFDTAMKIIVPCYELKVAEQDINDFVKKIKDSNPDMVKAPEEYLKAIATRNIEKQLVFIALAEEWNIKPTDQDAKNMLLDYYKATNNPVREKLNDQAELDNVKAILTEQVVANRICASLKCKIDNEAIRKNALEDIERIKKAQAEKKQK